MPQFDFGVIDPSTKSGSQLASDLNNQRNAINSFHLGASEPSYKVSGMIWIDIAANPIWKMKCYDGSGWISLFDLDTVSDSASAYIAGLLAVLGTASERNIGLLPDNVPSNSLLGALAYLSTVNTGNIANNAITTALLASQSVTADKLGVGAVTTTKLFDRGVTLLKLAPGSPGKVIGFADDGTPTELDTLSGNHGYAFYGDPGSYSWSVPVGVKYARVYVVGAGAGGGGNIGRSGNGGASSFGGFFIGNGGGGAGGGGGSVGSAGGGGGGGGSGDASKFYIVQSGGSGSSMVTAGTTVPGGQSWFEQNTMSIATGIAQDNIPNLAALSSTLGSYPYGRGGYATYAGAGGAGGTVFGTIDLEVSGVTDVAISVGAGGGRGSYSYDKKGINGYAGCVLIVW